MNFEDKVKQLFDEHEVLLSRRNEPQEKENGIITRYKHPILTAAHTPVFWRYDLDEKTNPYLMERIGMNATLNSGAIMWNGKYVLVVRVEEPTASLSLPWPKAPTALTTSASGTIPSRCPKM